MKIKEFEATSLRECLQQVRQSLGPEAVILETKQVKRGGIMGWKMQDAVRIVAATGITVSEPSAGPARSAAMPSSPPSPESPARSPKAAGFAQHAEPAPAAEIRRLEREIRELRSGVVAALAHAEFAQPNRGGAEPEIAGLRTRLIENELPEEMADTVLGMLPDLGAWPASARAALAESALLDQLARRITCAPPAAPASGKQARIALIGPTGVGKTTTIAKLAARYALVDRRRIGLLTLDTYRIAAVEQLRTYAQIIGIPLKVAHNAQELAGALSELNDCEVVLIDTAGRSHRHSMQVQELRPVLAVEGVETHLALSAGARLRDLREQIERFGSAGRLDCLLFTKLDETTGFGALYSAAAECGIPISYLSTGQRVPEDIELADPRHISSLALAAQAGTRGSSPATFREELRGIGTAAIMAS